MSTLTTPGNVCRTQDLHIAGMPQTDIRQAVASGNLVRLRHGWYCRPDADEKVVRAVRAGGALSCASALAFHGAWDVTGSTVHGRLDHNHTSKLPPGMRRCRSRGPRDDRAPRRAVDDLDVALRCAWQCLDQDDFVVVCDSLLHRHLMTLEEIRQALGPLRGRDDVLDQCDTAESGSESLVRLRLRRMRVKVRPQVEIVGIGRVDFLIGTRLVIEVDSRAHHTGEERYRSDRERDLRLMALGYVVVRLTYEQVMFHWADVEVWLRQVIRRFGASRD